MRGSNRRSVLFFAVLLALSSCRRALPVPPARPPRAGPSQSIIDADGVLHEGTAVSGAFEWVLPASAHGRLRLGWTTTGERGEVSLVAEMLPAGGGPPRGVGRSTRRFPQGSASGVFFDEDWSLPSRAGPSRLRLRREPAGPFFLTDLRVVQPDARAGAVWLLLFDTTRRDAVGLYGCQDSSTPHLDAIFRGGWRAERAYAPASWTIPSVASLLTGRVPGAQQGPDGAPRGVVAGMATIATDFRRAGWSTGAFIANPTVNAGNGFAEGFTTFFTTPYAVSSMTLPAEATTRHVPKWLAAHRGEPFFLWIFLLDPHDPYTPPDRPRGVTPFDPGYRGNVMGDEIERLQIGLLPRPSDRDIRHLQALYHDEIRYADSKMGELWKGLDSEERARATLVFTSDHGEEFAEHGGWKHGPALFDEVLRVPLLVRSRGAPRLPPASTLVSLMDLLPTMEALAGLPAPRRPLDGRNLLEPAVSQRPSLPAITMLTGGGARAAVIRGTSKLLFFDRLGERGMPDREKDPNGWRVAQRLRLLLPALGRFDLATDSGETRRLPISEHDFPAEWRAVEEAIAGTRSGLEVRFLGSAGSPPVRFVLEGFPSGAAAEPFALDEDDRFTWRSSTSGAVLTGTLDLAADIDGFLVAGPASDLKLTVQSSGCVDLTLASARTALVSGRAEAIPKSAVHATLPRFQRRDGCAGIFLWRAVGGVPVPPEETDERVKKLRALGYLH